MPLPNVPDPVPTLLFDGRLPALLTGIVLLGWGAKVYRLLVLAPGVLAGVYLGAALRDWLNLGGTNAMLLTVALAAGGALLCHFVEGVAIRVGGAALFGALAWFGWPLVQAGAVPWYVPLAALVLGAALFPRLYQLALRPITALVGAWSIAWAVHRPTTLWLVGGLALVGLALQYTLDRPAAGGDTSPEIKKRKTKRAKGG